MSLDSVGDPQIHIKTKQRMLVLCFDGTSNEFSKQNTNVVKLFKLLKKDKPGEQLCYYQPGIGTYFKPGVVSPLLTWLAKTLDAAFAWYLDAHVLGGYEFLMENWRDGDKICLFGFSRGAYIARALAGLLYKVGLLSKNNSEQLCFAYKLYKRKDESGIELAAGFKETFCRNVKIEFVGVWDTVSSVGGIISRTLPFTSCNMAIRTFRHALALDERRAKFQPNLYRASVPNGRSTPLLPSANDRMSTSEEASTSSTISLGPTCHPSVNSSRPYMKLPRADIVVNCQDADIQEVWFPGCHSDIGGSAEPDTKKNSLSNITLRWMVYEVMKSQCGILFDDVALARAGIPVQTFLGVSSSSVAKEVQLDDTDAIEPIHDSLKEKPPWWSLEFMFFRDSWQDLTGSWQSTFRMNFGRGRQIQVANPIFHRSVKQRMESGIGYIPNANWKSGSEVYLP